MKYEEYELPWSEFLEDVYQLVDDVKQTGAISSVFSVNPGGVIIGGIIAHALDIPIIQGPHIIHELRQGNGGVLIVNDICDRATSFASFSEGGCKTAVLYMKRNPLRIRKPDFYVRDIQYESWVVFPYETKSKRRQTEDEMVQEEGQEAIERREATPVREEIGLPDLSLGDTYRTGLQSDKR